MAASVERTLRKKLIRKAHHNKTLQARVLPLVQAPLGQSRMLTASQRFDLVEAIRLVSGKEAAGLVSIEKMPGFSPMQLRQQIDRVGQMRREIEVLASQYEAVLKQLRDLEKEERKGLGALKKAASEMRAKGKFCADAENALLQFTAYSQEKRPGIEQMIAHPEDTKWGVKAGDLFGRIANKLGADIAKDVETMYEQCAEDLTHTASAIRGLKVVVKTSNLPQEVIKTAGLVDTLVSIKEWIAGKANSVAQRILNFAGDISRWLKGFVERTKLVGKANTDLKKSLDGAMKNVDRLLAGA